MAWSYWPNLFELVGCEAPVARLCMLEPQLSFRNPTQDKEHANLWRLFEIVCEFGWLLVCLERVRKQHPVVFDLLNVPDILHFHSFPSWQFVLTEVQKIRNVPSPPTSARLHQQNLSRFTRLRPLRHQMGCPVGPVPRQKEKSLLPGNRLEKRLELHSSEYHNMIQRLLLFNSFYWNLSQGFSPLQSQASDCRIAGSSNGCCWGCSRDGLGKSWAQVPCSTSRSE